jgi:hypothetical protein
MNARDRAQAERDARDAAALAEVAERSGRADVIAFAKQRVESTRRLLDSASREHADLPQDVA